MHYVTHCCFINGPICKVAKAGGHTCLNRNRPPLSVSAQPEGQFLAPSTASLLRDPS